jgi:hypothetical protein
MLALVRSKDVGRAGDGDFVQSVVCMYDHRPLRTEGLENFCDCFDECAVENTHDLPIRPGWVCQRSEDVEYRSHAERLADRNGVFHCRVMAHGEAEAYAGIGEAAGDSLDVGVDIDAKCCKYVG